jgi:hypothetical protein
MVAIVTRAGKGSPLTNAEVDSNFTNLNNGKLESNSASTFVDLSSASGIESLKVGGLSNTYRSVPANVLSFASMPMGSEIWHDLFAFLKFYTATFETFDGTTWTAGTVNKELFAQKENQSIQVVNGTTTTAARWTFTDVSFGSAQWLVIGHAWNSGGNPSKTVTVETSADNGVTWTSRHQSTYVDHANAVFHRLGSYFGDARMRITIQWNSGGPIQLSNIKLLTARPGDQGRGKEAQLPFSWNGDQDVTIGRNLSVPGTLTVTGAISGNASSATILQTGRTIGMTGDVTWTSAIFNGSANVTGTATLANSGVAAGTYTKVTVDAKGRVTVGAALASADLPTYTGTITSTQVATALGYTPANKAGDTFTGNVGIGKDVPSGPLHIKGANGLYVEGAVNTNVGRMVMTGSQNEILAVGLNGIYANGRVKLGAGAITPANGGWIDSFADGQHIFYGASSAEIGRFTAARFFGLGTATPAHKLTVQDTVDTYAQIATTATDGVSGVVLLNDSRSWVIRNNGANGDSLEIRDATANAQRLIINAAGNATFSNQLSASQFNGSAAGLTGLRTVNGNSIVGSGNIQIDGGVTSFNTRTGAVTLSSGDVTTALGFTPYNNSNPSGFVTSAGSVAFATSSNSASGKWTSAAIAGSQSGNTSAVEVRNNGGTGDSNFANITFHCQGTYGTSLHLRSDGYFGVGGWSAATWRWYVNLGNGDMVAAGNITAYSDERLKKDWGALPDDFVERLAEVRHGTYTRIDSGARQVGVGAQSLRGVLPDAVGVGEDGDTLQVSYGNAALASAVKLAQRVVELTARLRALEQKMGA